MTRVIIAFLILFLAGSYFTSGQVQLLPGIGLNVMPSDNDSICYIPMFNGNYSTSGIQEGDTASEFKLYGLLGDSIQLSAVLNSGKPVLMIAGSYTCPVFRNKISSINNVINTYGNQIEVIVIYTLEAHPDIDTSVYFGYVNPGATNLSEGILYNQHDTYGQRKMVLMDMLNNVTLNAPVYIDGPCNEWWSHYGPAPNNAYLIDTNGVVFTKHAWYDKYPDNIICDIDSLLGNPSNCSGNTGNGNFSFSMVTNDTIYGTPGSTITLSGDLVNNSNTDLLIDMRRLINDMPSGWASSLCVDVCYSTTTDSAVIVLPMQSTLQFHFYIYTNNQQGIGRARVRFRNLTNPNNQFVVNLFGISNNATGIQAMDNGIAAIDIFPVPANEILNVQINSSIASLVSFEIIDRAGKTIKTINKNIIGGDQRIQIDLNALSPGLYFLQLRTDTGFQKGIKFIKTD